MDKTTETPKQIREQSGLKEGTLIPREVSKALGRGLRQSFGQSLQTITLATEKLKDARWTDQIRTERQRIESILKALEYAEETRLVSGNNANLNPVELFEFSERMVEEKPKSGKVTTGTLTLRITNAIWHAFRNPLTPILGFSELIEKRNSDKEVVGNAKEINEASQKIADTFNSFHNAKDIELVTDNDGKTSIIPIYFANTQA